MKYCEEDLPYKIVSATDLLRFLGDALVAIINDKMPPEVPNSVREFLVECAELGGLELLDLYQEIITLISEYRKSK